VFPGIARPSLISRFAGARNRPEAPAAFELSRWRGGRLRVGWGMRAAFFG
jgi:hypothetical protein